MRGGKRSWTVLSFLIGALMLSAQSPDVNWEQRTAGSGSAWTQAFHAEADVLVNAGYFNGNEAFYFEGAPSFLMSNGGNDAYLAIYDLDGSLRWKQSFGGSGDDRIIDAVLDSEGHVLVTGSFQQSMDLSHLGLNLVLTSTGTSAAFIMEFDEVGNLNWALTPSEAVGDSWGSSLCLATDGSIWATGKYTGSMTWSDGANSLNSAGLSDVFITQVDRQGHISDAYTIGGAMEDVAQRILARPSGGIFLAGGFSGVADVDPSADVVPLIGNGLQDAFVTAYSSEMQLEWSRSFGGSATDKIEDMAIYTQGLAIGGSFTGTMEIEGAGTLESHGQADAWIAILDHQGNASLARSFGGDLPDAVETMAFDDNGGLHCAGTFWSEMNIPNGATSTSIASAGLMDVFVVEFDMSGATRRVQHWPGEGVAYGVDILHQEEIGFLMTHTFTGNLSFTLEGEMGISQANAHDMIMLNWELEQALPNSISEAQLPTWNLYPNPSAQQGFRITPTSPLSFVRLYDMQGRLIQEWSGQLQEFYAVAHHGHFIVEVLEANGERSHRPWIAY